MSKSPLRSKEPEHFQKLKSFLTQANKVLLSTHHLPDGDGLGAEAALFHYLMDAGKQCQVINPDPLPVRYQLLDPEGSFLLPEPEKEGSNPVLFDLWVIVDTNDPRRLGKLWETYSPLVKKIVFLDHHVVMGSGASIQYPPHTLVVSDTESSSIGELLHTLFGELKLAPLSSKMALGLYVSVMTDTNSFRYARTTPLAHRIAAEMIEHGVNPEDVYQTIYSSKEVSHLQLLGTLLQQVHVSKGGQVAWLEMDRKVREKFHASADDTLSFLNLLLLIRDVEIICFFREEDATHCRVSLKSKGKVAVHELAMELGGGGHEFAAGMGLKLPIDKAIQTVIPRLDLLISSYRSLAS